MYPKSWQTGEIQQKIYEAAEWCCEHCGMEFEKGSTLAKNATRRDGKPYVLTVHHINGNKADCSYENLVALCQRCHLHVQAVWQPGAVVPPKWNNDNLQWIIKRNLDFKLSLQMKLFEVER